MESAPIKDIKRELDALDEEQLRVLCLRLARYKKENKELLTYLLFEAHDENAFLASVRADMSSLFDDLPKGNVYYVKKSLRKILRFLNRHVKYSGLPVSELELRLFFAGKMKEARIPLHPGTVLYNMYQQQVAKIRKLLAALPEDLQADYAREIGGLKLP